MQRPDFSEITSGEEFNKWYWMKEEMIEICKAAGLPSTGRKFSLRDRIMYALDNGGKVMPDPPKRKPTSKFKWSKEPLSPDTLITDNITFGQNLRRFMEAQIGAHFSFNSDFMDWAKENEGKSLQDAVIKWEELEARKKDPSFRRQIAANNMMNQYFRDFFDENPERSFEDARKAWTLKRRMPMKDGFVRYESPDLDLLES
ncbi:MAG: DUF6434 domain-containing protein [Bacteroidota bacterium]